MAFDTELSPEMEKTYREWMDFIGHNQESGMNVSADYTGNDYDYRGFFKKNGPVKIGEGVHFTDEFKKPSHKSFSTESKYSQLGGIRQGGVWRGEDFVPSSFNMLVNAVMRNKK